MNKWIGIGRLTVDPELKYVGEDSAISTFTVAVDKFVNGEKKADFIRCKVWGKHAESLAEYKKKGDQIGVEGRIETGSYEDNDGNRRYTTEIVCEKIEYLSSKKEEQQEAPKNNKNSKNTNKQNNYKNKNK
jgi:single-strand DNA-binding protein